MREGWALRRLSGNSPGNTLHPPQPCHKEMGSQPDHRPSMEQSLVTEAGSLLSPDASLARQRRRQAPTSMPVDAWIPMGARGPQSRAMPPSSAGTAAVEPRRHHAALANAALAWTTERQSSVAVCNGTRPVRMVGWMESLAIHALVTTRSIQKPSP
jgi:hypothetical protein